MTDADAARYLSALAVMLDNAHDLGPGRICRLDLAPHVAEQMQFAARHAAERLEETTPGFVLARNGSR